MRRPAKKAHAPRPHKKPSKPSKPQKHHKPAKAAHKKPAKKAAPAAPGRKGAVRAGAAPGAVCDEVYIPAQPQSHLTFDASPAFVDLSAAMPPVWNQGDEDSCVEHAESALGVGEHTDVRDLQACLSDGFPVAFGCTLFESFGLEQAVVETPAHDEHVAGPHCMVIVGIGFGYEWAEFLDVDPGARYVKVRNSWGADAHVDGHLLMSVSYLLAHAADFWTTRSAT